MPCSVVPDVRITSVRSKVVPLFSVGKALNILICNDKIAFFMIIDILFELYVNIRFTFF